jgi:tetratricopeptide (TPR) repeat protein
MHEAALRQYEKGIAIYDEVIRESPNGEKYRVERAQVEGMMGNLLLRMNRPSESFAPISRALEVRETLVKQHPEKESYRSELTVSLIQIARLRRAQGQVDAALDSLKRAKALLDATGTPKDTVLYNRACLLAQEGETLTRLGRGTADEGDAQGKFDAAIDALRQAVAAGFGDQSSLLKDPDLDPVRARGDFQALLADLAFPARPFVRDR